jgi:predicted DNA-binding protein (MmcQ/YjbR family)
MNVDEIRNFCLAFPQTTEKLQWGDALCFKTRGKMFAVLGLDRVRFTFKCTPETFAELIERQNIRPSPYLARYKWVMLDRLDALRNDELRDLIRLSYEMVAAKAHGDARTTSRNARKSAAKRPAVRLRSGRVSRARGKRTRS